MPDFIIVLIVVLCVAVIFCTLMFAFALYALKEGFGGRFDKNKYLKYFSAEDFNLNVLPVETADGKVVLRGNIYWRGELSKSAALVIFSHGMGPGQCAYTTEISRFCDSGFAVLAFECAGSGLSDGKRLGGLEASTRALVAAAQFAASDERLKNFKTFYAGHSMGAYSSLCAAAFIKPCGAVAFAAPERPAAIVEHNAAQAAGRFVAKLLRPFVGTVLKLRFGRYGNMSASRAVCSSGVPAVIFHGDCDTVVPIGCSAYAAADCPNAERVLCSGKGHNPYNTFAAEKLLKELGGAVMSAEKTDPQKRDEYFASVDYRAVCEEDDSVMQAAVDFIKKCLK